MDAEPARRLPMFPLGTVLFPFAPLALHVFEPRYRVLVHDVLGSDREFGVVLIERGSEVGGGDVRFDVGTVARVVRFVETPDGRYGLDTVGIRRVRVTRWLPDDPHPQALVTTVDEPAPGHRADRLRATVQARLTDVVSLCARLDPRLEGFDAHLDADPVRASYEAAAVAPLGPIDGQRVLETVHVDARLGLLVELFDEQIELLRARLAGGPS